jgi:type VI secretion system protein ImpM
MSPGLGFFGKLPARGDFVRSGLPRDFVSRWDAWLSSVLPAALEATGDGWLRAPVWRFSLASGVCGDAAAGMLFPSFDKVGRRFPLTLARLGPGLGNAIAGESLAAMEKLGRTAIDQTLAPDELAKRLAALPGVGEETPESGSLWWEAFGRQRSFVLPALPDVGSFAEMMMGDVA